MERPEVWRQLQMHPRREYGSRLRNGGQEVVHLGWPQGLRRLPRRSPGLEDHVLEVALAVPEGGHSLQGRPPLVCTLAHPEQKPGGEGDPQAARLFQWPQPHRQGLAGGLAM